MTNQASGKRLAAILWFVAAGLAFVALALSLGRGREPNLTAAGGGLFCLVMGIMLWRSQGRPSE